MFYAKYTKYENKKLSISLTNRVMIGPLLCLQGGVFEVKLMEFTLTFTFDVIKNEENIYT